MSMWIPGLKLDVTTALPIHYFNYAFLDYCLVSSYLHSFLSFIYKNVAQCQAITINYFIESFIGYLSYFLGLFHIQITTQEH